MGVIYQKNVLPKSFEINSKKSHKISKNFDKKQKIDRQKMKRRVLLGTRPPLPPPRLGRVNNVEASGYTCCYQALCQNRYI